VLSVGNGDFAYTADITGMQTFTAYHDPMAALMAGGVAVNTATMSSWGWHAMPNPEGHVLEDAMTEYQTPRGPVRYPDRFDVQAAAQGLVPDDQKAGAWLHTNPQRIDLGRIGLELRTDRDGEPETDPSRLIDPEQRLDLWSGLLTSEFGYAGDRLRVETVAAMDSATVAFRIAGAPLTDGRARVRIAFPYASESFFQTDDWNAPERHTTHLVVDGEGRARIERQLDETRYVVLLRIDGGRVIPGATEHELLIESDGAELGLVARFETDPSSAELADFEAVSAGSARHWQRFWQSGAAVDLDGSADPRARELERRLVLSQYLTRVHSAGTLPPQETGLVTNSWSGKFHLEMHFWHAAHFAAWGRPELLRRSLDWYRRILPSAQATAVGQGYPGARWPKQVGPDGRESPDPTGSLLIWQQPHILYLLELARRASPADEQHRLATAFADVVHETATFMAAFPTEVEGVLHLGPPVMPAQEFYDSRTTEDPTFELAYWWWGLELAQQWRERAGAPRDPQWSDVQQRLAAPRIVDGRYVPVGSSDVVRRDDHPALLAALGLVPPTPLIDSDVMRATFDDVVGAWDWPTAWGWDFPVMAMTATRLHRPDTAIDALLRPEERNRITVVGHSPQIGGILPIYLPSNGALLSAVSMMIASSAGTLAGFPEHGWTVEHEGFVEWP
jgi:hypothetical protein